MHTHQLLIGLLYFLYDYGTWKIMKLRNSNILSLLKIYCSLLMTKSAKYYQFIKYLINESYNIIIRGKNSSYDSSNCNYKYPKVICVNWIGNNLFKTYYC